MNAWMFEGNTISCDGPASSGLVTVTVGGASSFVSVRSVLRARTRGTIPVITIRTATIAAVIASTRRVDLRIGFASGLSNQCYRLLQVGDLEENINLWRIFAVKAHSH